MNFNRVLIGGNLTRDPQLRYLPNQTPVVEFGVAVNERYKSGEEVRERTHFVDVSMFGKRAEVVNGNFSKGKPIFLEGRLSYETWEDKNGGGKRSKLSVVADDFQFVGKKEQ